MENPAATSRPEVFPVGLRVLVVDDDPTWLKILEKMLRKCSYEVTTCSLARVALEMLRERKEKFDIVISDVNMPDMDGFKLLEHVGLEMDLPVIMMSVDGETSRVMKGVQHGACDYLHKPIRMKELRNIWQHVYRKKIHEVKEIESQDINEDIHFIRNGSGDFDDKQLLNGSDLNSLRKRKDVDSKEHSDQDFNDSATAKKARVVWSVDLHQKFVNAVNQIGLDKVGPKKILDLMNIPGLTRENVASHLQKYRLYLSRLQKQNEGRIFGANMEPDFSSKDRPVNFTNQNPTSVQRNTTADGHPCSAQKINAQSILPDIHVDEIKSIVSVQVKDHKEAADAGKVNVVLSFKGEMPSTDHRLREPAKHQTWSGSIPLMQFMQYPKHDHEPYGLLEDYSFPLQTRQQFAPPVISITRGPEKDKMGLSQIKPVFTIDSEDFGAAHEISVLPSSKDGVELASSLPEDLSLCALQGIGYFENVDLNSMEFFEYDDSASMEVHSNWFDGLEINCEYLYDSVIDECLFA